MTKDETLYIVSINGKPTLKYTNKMDAMDVIARMKSRHPKTVFAIEEQKG